ATRSRRGARGTWRPREASAGPPARPAARDRPTGTWPRRIANRATPESARSGPAAEQGRSEGRTRRAVVLWRAERRSVRLDSFRNLDALEYLLHYEIRRDALHIGFGLQYEAMTQHRRRGAFHIVRQQIVSSIESLRQYSGKARVQSESARSPPSPPPAKTDRRARARCLPVGADRSRRH